jgi:hypothetical protein
LYCLGLLLPQDDAGSRIFCFDRDGQEQGRLEFPHAARGNKLDAPNLLFSRPKFDRIQSMLSNPKTTSSRLLHLLLSLIADGLISC